MKNLWPVLIVSPEMGNRRYIASVLEGWGMESLCAGTVKEAREILMKREIPLVFCEDRLPDGDFQEVVQAAKFNYPAAYVVVTSRRMGDVNQFMLSGDLATMEVIPCPCYVNDVQWAIVHAMRKAGQVQNVA